MRIGIELKHLDAVRGGAEAYTLQFAGWLIASGHEVHLFVHDSTTRLNKAVIHQVSPFSPGRIGLAVQSVAPDFFIGTDQSVSMDLFHPHRGTIRGNANGEIARIENIMIRKLARAANAINPRYRKARALERRQVGSGKDGPVVIAVSEMIAAEFRSEFRLDGRRLRVVYNGVDTARFSPQYSLEHRREARRWLGMTDADVCYLLVANDFARKGVTQFIRATSLALQKEPFLTSVIVGRGDPGPYQRLAETIGCSGRALFVPSMQDIRTAYAAADVFVLPTWYDPCSLTVLEAWACGLPVITTAFNGASELMREGKEGYSIKGPGDIKLLADRMRALAHPEQRLTMGRLGRTLAERHSLENNFHRIMEIMCSGHGGGKSEP